MKEGKLSSIPSIFSGPNKLATAKFLDVSLKFQETPDVPRTKKVATKTWGPKKRSTSSLMLCPETIDLELPQHWMASWKIHHFFSREIRIFIHGWFSIVKIVGLVKGGIPSLKRTATFRPWKYGRNPRGTKKVFQLQPFSGDSFREDTNPKFNMVHLNMDGFQVRNLLF